jgi:hypothetical protein
LLELLEESILALLQELPLKKMPSLGKTLEKDKHKDYPRDVFNLFKKRKQSSSSPPGFLSQLFLDPQHQTGELRIDTQYTDLPPTAQRILKALNRLKNHYTILLDSLQSSRNEPSGGFHSPLPSTKEENVSDNLCQHPEPPRRHSIATTASDGTYEWHDAVDTINDGPEEFVMDAQLSPEPFDHVPTNDSQSSLERLDQSGDETDLEDEVGQPNVRLLQGSKYDVRANVRRTQLPSRVTGDEGSLLTVLKKNVGKVLLIVEPPSRPAVEFFIGSVHNYPTRYIQ